jgi:hypothetical protein
MTIRQILFATSHKPRIKLPAMITWSVRVCIQVLNPRGGTARHQVGSYRVQGGSGQDRARSRPVR